MFRRHFIARNFSIGACATAVVLCAPPARAAGKRAICTPALAAYKEAVEREKAGRLDEARELLRTCMEATVCGGLVPKCTAKFNALASAATPAREPASSSREPTSSPRAPVSSPLRETGSKKSQSGPDTCSVVPVVTDDAGEPRVDVQVQMDGTLLVSHLDGKGVRVDPGVHEFTFSTDAGVFSTQKIMIVEGQRNRPISASLHSPDKAARKTAVATSALPAPQAASDRPASDTASSPGETAQETAPAERSPEDQPPKKGARSPFIYALGGAGLLGVGAGVLMTYWGIKDNQSLSQCSPNCPQASVDHIRALYIASDISAGVGVAALGVATWLFVRSGSSGEKPPSPEAFKLDIHPTGSGAFASVSRAF